MVAVNTYCVLPRGRPPQVRNCLLDRINGTSEQGDPGGRGLLPEGMTSPFNTTSYWGPNGCTNILKILTEEEKTSQVSHTQFFWQLYPIHSLCPRDRVCGKTTLFLPQKFMLQEERTHKRSDNHNNVYMAAQEKFHRAFFMRNSWRSQKSAQDWGLNKHLN